MTRVLAPIPDKHPLQQVCERAYEHTPKVEDALKERWQSFKDIVAKIPDLGKEAYVAVKSGQWTEALQDVASIVVLVAMAVFQFFSPTKASFALIKLFDLEPPCQRDVLKRERDDLDRNLNETATALNRKESELAAKDEEKNHLKDYAAQLQEQNDGLKKQNGNYRMDSAEKDRALVARAEEKRRLQDENKKSAEQLRETQNDLHAAVQRSVEKEQEASAARAQNEALATDNQTLQSQCHELHCKLQQLEEAFKQQNASAQPPQGELESHTQVEHTMPRPQTEVARTTPQHSPQRPSTHTHTSPSRHPTHVRSGRSHIPPGSPIHHPGSQPA